MVKQGESRQSKPFAGSGLFYSSDEEEEDNDTDPVHPPNAAIKSEWNDVPEGVAREDEPMPRPTSWLAKGGTVGVSVVAQLPYVPYMGSSVVPQSWAREWRKNADVETLETSAFEARLQTFRNYHFMVSSCLFATRVTTSFSLELSAVPSV